MTKKSKVLLINPPFTAYGKLVAIRAAEPLGLMYLAAYLKERDVQVEILDAVSGAKGESANDGFFTRGLS